MCQANRRTLVYLVTRALSGLQAAQAFVIKALYAPILNMNSMERLLCNAKPRKTLTRNY